MPATSSSASAEPAMAFQFVNLQDPSDSKDENVRRSIRSFVTKQQHQKADKMIAARRSNSDSQLQATSNPIPSEQQRSVSPGSTSDAALSASSPTQATMIDVSRVYPVQWLPYLNQILENYLTFTAREILQSDDAPTMSLLRAVWMPFVMTDMALLHSVLLLAASLFRSSRPAQAQVVDLLQLKDMAIQAMNDSLSTKDSMIATMATMAQFEAFWQDGNALSTHMSGLSQFVDMRGGLATLGLNGFLERMLVAIDCHNSRTTGLPRLFAVSSPGLN